MYNIANLIIKKNLVQELCGQVPMTLVVWVEEIHFFIKLEANRVT